MAQSKTSTLGSIVFYGLLIAAIIVIIASQKSCGKGDSLEETINALNDSLRVLKQQDSTQTAEILLLRTEKVKTFENLDVKNLEVLRLQEVVKEYADKLRPGSSVTKVTSDTKIASNRKPTVIRDTVYYDPGNNFQTIQVYPEYRDTVSNKWVDYTMSMSEDSSKLDLTIRNEYDVVIGIEKGKPFALVHNHNPYTSVSSLRAYQVTMPKEKRFGIGLHVGYGVDYKLRPTPYIGVGVSYNLIKF